MLYEVRYESVEHWMLGCESGTSRITLRTTSGNCLTVTFSTYDDLERFAALLKERCCDTKKKSSKPMQTIQLEASPRDTKSPKSHITVPLLVEAPRAEIHKVLPENHPGQGFKVQPRVKSSPSLSRSEDNIFTEPQHVGEVVFPLRKSLFGPLFPEATLSRKVDRLRTRVLRGFMRLRTYGLFR